MYKKFYKVTKNEQDKKKRKLFNKYEKEKKILQYIINNLNLSKNVRKYAFQKLKQIPRNSSKARIVNRCIVTGRAKGVFSEFGLSRIKFRELVQTGALPGFRKSS